MAIFNHRGSALGSFTYSHASFRLPQFNTRNPTKTQSVVVGSKIPNHIAGKPGLVLEYGLMF